MPKLFVSDISGQGRSKKRKIGRPQHEEANEVFLKIMNYLQENDDAQLIISDLVRKMLEFLNDSSENVYSNRYMKDKVENYFGENVIITNVNGRPNVVTLRKTATSILNEFHKQQRNDDPEAEKMNIVITAAKLIKSDIKLVSTCSENYPTIKTNVQSHIDFLPSTLKLFLEGVLAGKNTAMKIVSIGQAIVQSARPRGVLSPLQVGLAIQLHHSFASRFLIN